MEDYLIEGIAALLFETTIETLENLIQLDIFKNYCAALLKMGGETQARMIIEYIKDVSKMLSLIYVVRENSIELHLAAERAMLPKYFAFDHPNYFGYLTAQHVNLSALSTQKSETWEDLLANGFGGSLSGEPFSTIHGHLITETAINREVKVRRGQCVQVTAHQRKLYTFFSKSVISWLLSDQNRKKIGMCYIYCT